MEYCWYVLRQINRPRRDHVIKVCAAVLRKCVEKFPCESNSLSADKFINPMNHQTCSTETSILLKFLRCFAYFAQIPATPSEPANVLGPVQEPLEPRIPCLVTPAVLVRSVRFLTICSEVQADKWCSCHYKCDFLDASSALWRDKEATLCLWEKPSEHRRFTILFFILKKWNRKIRNSNGMGLCVSERLVQLFQSIEKSQFSKLHLFIRRSKLGENICSLGTILWSQRVLSARSFNLTGRTGSGTGAFVCCQWQRSGSKAGWAPQSYGPVLSAVCTVSTDAPLSGYRSCFFFYSFFGLYSLMVLNSNSMNRNG